MINIGGLQKVSLIDYPDKIAAAVFLAGCNFKCPYCHNPELTKIDPNKKYYETKKFFDYLEKRKNILEGVCVSGGEPLIYKDLDRFLAKIKKIGLLIKLDTNGTNPEFLAKLIKSKLVDFVAMDVKASEEKYDLVAGKKVNFKNIKKSIEIIMQSGLDYEFRVTVLPKYHDYEEIEKIAKLIKGAKSFSIQNFNNKITLDSKLAKEHSFTDNELNEFKKISLKYIKKCQIKN